MKHGLPVAEAVPQLVVADYRAHLLVPTHDHNSLSIYPRTPGTGHHLLDARDTWRRRGLERWAPSRLGKVLGGERRWKDKPREDGLLPAGMSASSLRRTFGSIRLRDGRTTPEVAAEMGNTEDVVRSNYARILGREVRPD